MLIEKEILLKQMEGYCSANCGHEHGEDPLCPSCFMNDAIILVEDQPAADVRPVVRGKWIYDCERTAGDGWTYRQYHCDQCKCQVIGGPYNYCQNCGADMREAEDGDLH